MTKKQRQQKALRDERLAQMRKAGMIVGEAGAEGEGEGEGGEPEKKKKVVYGKKKKKHDAEVRKLKYTVFTGYRHTPPILSTYSRPC